MNNKDFKMMVVLENRIEKILGKNLFNQLFDTIDNLSDDDYLKVLAYIYYSNNPTLATQIIISHAKQKTLKKYL